MLKEEIIKDIAKAIYIKRRLDGREFPKFPKDSIGQHLVIPDLERSNEDILEDRVRNEAMAHPELVETVFKGWMGDLYPLEFMTIYFRLCTSFLTGRVMPWKSVSKKLYDNKIIDRYYSSRHLLRIFNETIGRIERRT